QARRRQGRYQSRGSARAKIDADAARRTYTCRWKIPPFSCETDASRGSSRIDEKIYMMRPIFAGLIAACLANVSPMCRAAYAQQEPEVIDGVAAIVNGDVITYSQVRALVGPREKLLGAQFQGEELIKKVKEVRHAALQDLIDRQLILQAFKKENYQIPDHFVEERMHDIVRTDFGGDRNTFL